MAGLQRSVVSFRRQGSSGLVWDDNFLSGELIQHQQHDTVIDSKPSAADGQVAEDHQQPPPQLVKGDGRSARTIVSLSTMERSRSNGGGRTYRTGKVSPAIDPPSPKVSACGFCGAFGRKQDKARGRRPKSGKPQT